MQRGPIVDRRDSQLDKRFRLSPTAPGRAARIPAGQPRRRRRAGRPGKRHSGRRHLILWSRLCIRAYLDLSSGCLLLLKDQLRLSKPDIAGDRHAPSRRFEPRRESGPAGAVRQRDDRACGRELVSRQAGPGQSRGGRHRPAGLPRRRFEPGHDHRRDHPAAVACDRGRQRRRLGPRQAAIAPAPACRLCRRQDPLRRIGLGIGRSPFVTPGPWTTPSRRRSGLPAPCGLHDQNGGSLPPSWKRCPRPGTFAGSAQTGLGDEPRHRPAREALSRPIARPDEPPARALRMVTAFQRPDERADISGQKFAFPGIFSPSPRDSVMQRRGNRPAPTQR